MAPTGGEILREARKRRGLTQAQLAERVGTDQAAVARWETDRRSPTVRQLTEMLSAMGLELELRAVAKRAPRGDGFGAILDRGQPMRRGKRTTDNG